MPPRNEEFRIRDILQAIVKIKKYLEGFTKQSFCADEKTQDAVLRNLSIIGEAAARLSGPYKGQYPEVPWRKMIGMRNFLVHEYFGVSSEILWSTVQTDLLSLQNDLQKVSKSSEPHPWRLCPLGQHWVRLHSRRVEPSSRHPEGETTVRSHCQHNPSHKDVIYSDELEEIAKHHFGDLTGAPCADSLKFQNGNKYDEYIRGWTKYWNEVLQPAEPLDPNLVKALIATESGFDPKALTNAGKSQGKARGLMQVTDASQKILAAANGELKNHLVVVPQKAMLDPNLNIAAGVRWLFRKKEIADSQSKSGATWLEAIAKYKKYPIDNAQMKKLRGLYDQLSDCKGDSKS